MKKLHSFLLSLSVCSMLMMLMVISANAMSVSMDGTAVWVTDLDPTVTRVFIAGFDSEGKQVLMETGTVNNQSATVSLKTNKVSELKVFALDTASQPAEQSVSVSMTKATRVWAAEQLCAFQEIDTSIYDPSTLSFTDCSALSDGQKQAVLAAIDNGFMAGAGNAAFVPDGTLTRAQAALLLYRMVGQPPVKSAAMPYTDVTENWYLDAVRYLYGIGALSDSSKFDGSSPVLKPELTSWLKCLKENGSAQSGTYSISNIRFETINGVVQLTWDFSGAATADVSFKVTAQSADGLWGHNQGSSENCIVPTFPQGSYKAVRVEMYERKSNPQLLAFQTQSVNVTVADGGQAADAAEVVFYELVPGDYLIDLIGLEDYDAFQIFFRNSTNQNSRFGLVKHKSEIILRETRFGDISGAVNEVYAFSNYVRTDAHTLSYTETTLLEECAVRIKSYYISNLRFVQEDGLPVLEWDVPIDQGISFEAKTNPSGSSGYQYSLGSTKSENSMPIALGEAGQYTGIQVTAFLNGEELKSSSNDNLSIQVNSVSPAPAINVNISWDSAKAQYCVKVSNLSNYEVYSIKFALNAQGTGSRIDSVGSTEGESVVTAYFRDDGTYCKNGYYQISAGSNYTISQKTNLSYDWTVFTDWTAHNWTAKNAASWLLPEQSVCPDCGLLCIDSPCLRDVAFSEYNTSSVTSSVFSMRSGGVMIDAYTVTTTFADKITGDTVYTDQIICRASDNVWLEVDRWDGAAGRWNQRTYCAELYDMTSSGTSYRQLAEFEYNAQHQISKKTCFEIVGDGTYILQYWYTDYTYDVSGNMLSCSTYEASGHKSWVYTYTYYPNGVRATESQLDPDSGNTLVRERCYTVDGKMWKLYYDGSFHGGVVEVYYYLGYSAQNPYVYTSIQTIYDALSGAASAPDYTYHLDGTSLTFAGSGAVHCKTDNDYYYFAVETGGALPLSETVTFPTGFSGSGGDLSPSLWCDAEVVAGKSSYTTYFRIPKSHITAYNSLCEDENTWALRIFPDVEQGDKDYLSLFVDFSQL